MCGKFKIQNSSVRVLLKLLAFQSSPTLPKARSPLLLYEIWKLGNDHYFLQRKVLHHYFYKEKFF